MIPYDDERVGLEAGNLSLELIEALSSAALPPEFERRLQAFLRFAKRQSLPVQDGDASVPRKPATFPSLESPVGSFSSARAAISGA